MELLIRFGRSLSKRLTHPNNIPFDGVAKREVPRNCNEDIYRSSRANTGYNNTCGSENTSVMEDRNGYVMIN